VMGCFHPASASGVRGPSLGSEGGTGSPSPEAAAARDRWSLPTSRGFGGLDETSGEKGNSIDGMNVMSLTDEMESCDQTKEIDGFTGFDEFVKLGAIGRPRWEIRVWGVCSR